jgi:HSP20 family protein
VILQIRCRIDLEPVIDLPRPWQGVFALQQRRTQKFSPALPKEGLEDLVQNCHHLSKQRATLFQRGTEIVSFISSMPSVEARGGQIPVKEVVAMELVPWRPFREISSLRGEMDKLWDNFFGERVLGKAFSDEWNPSVDISETENNLLIKAELPGLESKDVSVSISGDLLTIKGEKKKEKEEKDEHHHYIERYAGTFQRSFRLPVNVQSDKVEAAFKNGVLKITLPKVAEARKKAIEIKVK